MTSHAHTDEDPDTPRSRITEALIKARGKIERADVQSLPGIRGTVKAAGGKPEPAVPFADLPRDIRPRVFTSVDGWTILVGRSDKGNDHLTMRIANGNDYFFHLADSPGSHVILRIEKGQSPPLETMLDCAQLALYFSPRREALKADVHYTMKKHVRKPKGAKPGLVYVNESKTLAIRADTTRLARLLGKG